MLSLSSKYAIKALLYLANHPEEGFMRVDKLSVKANVPGPYLSKVMKKLAENKIIVSRRGLTGGIKLGRSSISVYDICQIMNDPIVDMSCLLSKHRCNSASPCAMHNKWGKLRDQHLQFLKNAKIS